jgi:hypothetical protein
VKKVAIFSYFSNLLNAKLWSIFVKNEKAGVWLRIRLTRVIQQFLSEQLPPPNQKENCPKVGGNCSKSHWGTISPEGKITSQGKLTPGTIVSYVLWG